MLIGANNMDSMFDNYENLLKGFKENAPKTNITLRKMAKNGFTVLPPCK